MVQEFKAFAVRGNVVDMAVGIIIGAAFGKIVSSAVADVVMPPLGLLVGGMDFSDLALTLKDATAAAPAVVLGYGKFIQALLDFTIVAFAVFLLVKGINTLKRKEAEAPSAPPEESTPTARDGTLLNTTREASFLMFADWHRRKDSASKRSPTLSTVGACEQSNEPAGASCRAAAQMSSSPLSRSRDVRPRGAMNARLPSKVSSKTKPWLSASF